MPFESGNADMRCRKTSNEGSVDGWWNCTGISNNWLPNGSLLAEGRMSGGLPSWFLFNRIAVRFGVISGPFGQASHR